MAITETPKHPNMKKGEAEERTERGGGSQREAGISEQAAGQPLSLTNYAHMQQICISKIHSGANIMLPGLSFFFCRSEEKR